MDRDNTNNLYGECLRNHAASFGSYATDGCGEFTLDHSSPAALQCAACGCHRNFHRRITKGASNSNSNRNSRYQGAAVTEVMLGYNGGGDSGEQQMPESTVSDRVSSKKRHRTKFTSEQKEKMLAFAEKLGWRMLRKDQEDEIERFCRSVGVSRKVFKVWMHNHKNSSSTSAGNASPLTH